MPAPHASEPSGTRLSLLPSGIHRFPVELLVEIFALCWYSFTPHHNDLEFGEDKDEADVFEISATAADETEIVVPPADGTSNVPCWETESARLAHAPLLAVSQVCRRWRAVAMGTPSLWCDIQLNGMHWDTPPHFVTAGALLKSVLERGGTLPLALTINSERDTGAFADPLDEHSHRWKSLVCPYDFVCRHSTLPHLETLEILVPEFLDFSGSMPRLSLPSMPRLTSLDLPALFLEGNMENLPLEQLSNLACRAAIWPDIPHTLTLLSLLPAATKFYLDLFNHPHLEKCLEIDLEPKTSNVSAFTVQFFNELELRHSKAALACFFQHLTLPLLKQLRLEAQFYPSPQLLWPHAEFLALAARSDFDFHLTSLEIYQVLITEEQLLECLAGLNSLERLAISDHPTEEGKGAADGPLITDTLDPRIRPAVVPCPPPFISPL
ncbi:hypothetical protein K438DRAFT_545481 [Mycena galopus ATCC 62051]|nr:hypothetical protein K438DRAFT_545481 [Mycena galopus ATCC 62051]